LEFRARALQPRKASIVRSARPETRPENRVREAGTLNKSPKTKDEIQDAVTAQLRRFPGCEEAWGVVVVGLDSEITGATWTVSRFNRGESSAHACDRALQVIVPHYQRLYDLQQKH
jgi:hypothetical protein